MLRKLRTEARSDIPLLSLLLRLFCKITDAQSGNASVGLETEETNARPDPDFKYLSNSKALSWFEVEIDGLTMPRQDAGPFASSRRNR